MCQICTTRNQYKPFARFAFFTIGVLATLPGHLNGQYSSKYEAIRASFDKQRTELEVREREAIRRDAKIERNEVQQKMEQVRSHLEQLKRLRRWALQLDEQEQWDNAPDPAVWSKYLDRWKHSRQLARTQFLHFPEKSRGAVKSGRALNFFLDACGQAALEHETYLRQARDELKSATDPRERRFIEDKLALLEGFGGPEKLTGYDRQRIRCEMGGAGPKLITNLQDDPLPLDWPVLFRREQQFVPLCEAIREAKDTAMQEIVRRGGVQSQTMHGLTDAVDALQIAFDKQYREFLSGKREQNNAATKMPYISAKKFVRGLRHGVVRLYEARMEEDVKVGKFESETVGELLAFMCRNGLRFAEADTNGERTYARLFRMITNYYTDIYSIQIATEDTQRQLACLQQREAYLTRVMYDYGKKNANPIGQFLRDAALTSIHGYFEGIGRREPKKDP